MNDRFIHFFRIEIIFDPQNNFSKVSYKFNLKLELKGIGDRCNVKCLDIAPRKLELISR